MRGSLTDPPAKNAALSAVRWQQRREGALVSGAIEPRTAAETRQRPLLVAGVWTCATVPARCNASTIALTTAGRVLLKVRVSLDDGSGTRRRRALSKTSCDSRSR